MKIFRFILTLFLLAAPIIAEAAQKEEIPPGDVKWNDSEDPNRSISCIPSLFKDANFVYVYSEKQLDNLSIGITDMQGNVYHYEVATVPAGMYYAVSTASLPAGTYYLSIYQGSNYVIGMFTIN